VANEKARAHVGGLGRGLLVKAALKAALKTTPRLIKAHFIIAMLQLFGSSRTVNALAY